MMQAILSNDEEDWHSHFERGVKESAFDWHGGFFVIGRPRAGARGHPQPDRRNCRCALPGGRFAGLQSHRGNAPAPVHWRVGSYSAAREMENFHFRSCGNIRLYSHIQWNAGPLSTSEYIAAPRGLAAARDGTGAIVPPHPPQRAKNVRRTRRRIGSARCIAWRRAAQLAAP
ncbi:hypothetical protein [Burkholderia territorii]|uniref:hypothetical protein n=1 Tax=Burkholderia territorii TaxID=1503055 RepID=UPI0012D92B19|nr:hypothetical protein [Burkholderia territorii]